MMMAEMTCETSEIFNHLTRLIIRDDFNYFSRREVFSSDMFKPRYVSRFLP
jgi:hypothetical protein